MDISILREQGQWIELSERHRGSTHVVFKGRRTPEGPLLVLKTLRADFPDEKTVAGLRHEFSILEKLNISGVVEPIALKKVRGLPTLIMQDAGDRSIVDLLNGTAHAGLDLHTFFHIALPLTAILQDLHSAKIVHRNLSPSNIVLDAELSPTLIDFAQASPLSLIETDMVPIKALEGNLVYLAPEQSGRTGRPIDQRSDLYVLGLTFYEMLVGSPPFEGHDPLELLHAHLTRRPVAPHDRRPEIPAALSSIILKLLAKEPTQRYQSARALRSDLAQLFSQLERGEPVQLVHPADDPPRGLQWSRLHGRTQQMEKLLSCLELASLGRQETVFIEGPPGIGKTALVRELYQPVAERRGFFASGRFEPQALHRPYHGIYEALHWLTQNALTWGSDRLEMWLNGLRASLGLNVPVLTEITPDFANLLHDLPPLPPTGPMETRVRLHAAVRALLMSFASPHSPLVLFLDDCHLMDAGSLTLLEYLILEADIPNFLLVLAFRDGSELSEFHARMFTRLHTASASLTRISPPLLTQPQVSEMLAEMLDSPLDEILLVGQRLYQHSQGNPLILRQLLLLLVQGGSLTQQDSGIWEWDMRKIDQLVLRDDVVELLLRELGGLPESTLDVLVYAAGLGERFELDILAMALERPALDVADTLWPAVSSGLLLPVQASYQVMRRLDSPVDEVQGLNAVFRFMHARVAQAVWNSLPAADRDALQLQLARICLMAWRASDKTDRLFDALYHLQQATQLLTDEQERIDCASLYLQGARRARETGACHSGMEFALCGIKLLPGDAWHQQTQLMFALHREAALCAWHEGEHERTSRLVTDTLDHHPLSLETVEFHILRLKVLCSSGQFVEAVAAGRMALAELEQALPYERLEEATDEILDDVIERLETGSLQLIEENVVTDPTVEATISLLCYLSLAGYFSHQALANYCVVRIAQLCTLFGRTGEAIHPLAYLGLLLGTQRSNYQLGHQVGRTAVLLSQRSGDAVQRCRALHIFGNHLNHWYAPLQEGAQLLRDAISSGLEGGEVQFVAYAAAGLVLNLLSQGELLVEIVRELTWGITFSQKHGNIPMELLHQVCQLFIRWLQSQTEEFGQEAARAQADLLEQHIGDDSTLQCISLHLRMRAAVLIEDWSAAAALLERLEPLQPYTAGIPLQAEFPLFAGICLARQAESRETDAREPLQLELDRHLGQLLHYAEGCPHNYSAKAQILLAERALLRGNVLEAADHYEQAAESARAAGFLVDEALAHELAGRMWWRKGRRLAARGHLQAAARGYALWGASRKVHLMGQQYPDLELPTRSLIAQASADGHASPSTEPSSFDLTSLMKASSSIIGELEQTRLMERLLQVTLETAGAEFAALMLMEGERLMVRATLDHSLNQFYLHDIPLDHCELVSATMVNYSRRTGRPLVVGAAEASGLFRDDPYIQRRKPRSILCLPMVHRARIIGLLYLENNLIPHAFNTRRLELLGLLSTQLAVALENGRLYLGLQREIGERVRAEEALRELNAALEQRVAERTRTLERLNAELEQFAYITSHDLQEPLRTITAFLGLLEEDYAAQLPDEGKYYVRTAVEGAMRMRDLIRDLLAYSRVGGSNKAPAPTDLNEVMRQVRQNLALALEESGAVLTASDLPTVMASPREMVQLFQNLVSNALKFRSERPPQIVISARRPGAEWEVRISDNGIGIDPAHHQKIFQVFQRLHVREQYPGNGIGLAIVRKVVERFGGTVQVQSEPGQGSTFILRLPATPEANPDSSWLSAIEKGF